MVRVRPDVEPLELMPTEMPPPEMVGVLTGTGSAGNGTLTVDDPLLEGVVTVAGAGSEPDGVVTGRLGTLGTVAPVGGSGSEGTVDVVVEPPGLPPTPLSA
jgi:hypothetical protein